MEDAACFVYGIVGDRPVDRHRADSTRPQQGVHLSVRVARPRCRFHHDRHDAGEGAQYDFSIIWQQSPLAQRLTRNATNANLNPYILDRAVSSIGRATDS